MTLKTKILIGIFVLLLLSFIVMSLPIFNIEYVEINGIDNIKEESVMSKIFYKDDVNIFALNKKKLEKELKNIPYVKEVVVSKKLPNKLVIDIVERRTIGYITYGDEIYVYIDGDGIVLEMQNYTDEQKPFFSGLYINEVTKGKKLDVENERVFDIAVTLANAFDKFDFANREISIRLDDEDDIIFYIDNIKVLFGDVQNIHKKMAWLESILENALDKKDSGVLDLRFPDRNPVYSGN